MSPRQSRDKFRMGMLPVLMREEREVFGEGMREGKGEKEQGQGQGQGLRRDFPERRLIALNGRRLNSVDEFLPLGNGIGAAGEDNDTVVVEEDKKGGNGKEGGGNGEEKEKAEEKDNGGSAGKKRKVDAEKTKASPATSPTTFMAAASPTIFNTTASTATSKKTAPFPTTSKTSHTSPNASINDSPFRRGNGLWGWARVGGLGIIGRKSLSDLRNDGGVRVGESVEASIEASVGAGVGVDVRNGGDGPISTAGLVSVITRDDFSFPSTITTDIDISDGTLTSETAPINSTMHIPESGSGIGFTNTDHMPIAISTLASSNSIIIDDSQTAPDTDTIDTLLYTQESLNTTTISSPESSLNDSGGGGCTPAKSKANGRRRGGDRRDRGGSGKDKAAEGTPTTPTKANGREESTTDAAASNGVEQ